MEQFGPPMSMSTIIKNGTDIIKIPVKIYFIKDSDLWNFLAWMITCFNDSNSIRTKSRVLVDHLYKKKPEVL